MSYTAFRRILGVVVAAGALVVTALPLAGQAGKNWDWRNYGSDLANTHYAPLDQINADNFGKLEVAWRFQTANLGPRPEFQYEGTPLMVNGVLYATAGTRRAVVALDPTTGEELWMHSEREGDRGAAAPRQLSGRGLAYWSDGHEERILYVTPGYRLLALDAKTGAPIPTFGQNGIVDLKLDDDQQIDLVTGEVGLHATPVVTGDVVIVGAAHRPGGSPKSKTNVKGFVRAFDVRTGKRLWIFHTIPMPGEFGNDTWLNDSWSYTGNTGVWGQIAVDEQLGTVYLPVELPTGDYYGGNRPGNGLFGESLVAVDIKTGKRKWHYQLVHHGLWDMDIPTAPILGEATVNGRTIKVAAQPTKQSFLYVFDRTNGQPLWPFQERPVPKGDVPGEWYSPTQPFPTKPPAYDRQGVSIDDLIDFTPELRTEATQLVSKYKIGPLFTPPVVSKPDGPYATLVLPSSTGGANWPGGAYDPDTHTVYIYSQTNVTALGLVPTDLAVNDFGYIQGNAAARTPAAGGRGGAAAAGGGGRGGAADAEPATGGGGRGGFTPAGGPSAGPAAPGGGGEGGGPQLNVQGLPLIKPPYGRITALNLDRGDITWQVAHGDTPDNIRNSSVLKGLTIPKTGQRGIAGTLVTKTLVIAGEPQVTTAGHPRGALLRAYDKATGKEIGGVFMPAQATGAPMTYMVNGKQYIVIAIGGGGFPAELIAFKLPA